MTSATAHDPEVSRRRAGSGARFLSLTPRDPVIVRDGRPFGAEAGSKARSLDWLTPSLLAGSVRSAVGKAAGGKWVQLHRPLLRAGVAGGFPIFRDALYLPAPRDVVIEPARDAASARRVHTLRPAPLDSTRAGALFPTGLSELASLPPAAAEPFEPEPAPAWWNADLMARALVDATGSMFAAEERLTTGVLDTPRRDERVHLEVSDATSTAEEGMLFTTSGLEIEQWQLGKHAPRLTVRWRPAPDDTLALDGLDPVLAIGGERRLMRLVAEAPADDARDGSAVRNRSQESGATLWRCPGAVAKALVGAARVKLVLATMGLFSEGWRPGWLQEIDGGGASGPCWQGSPRGRDGASLPVTLRLVSACVPRWVPISGWSLRDDAGAWSPGPRKARRAVPAGAVYFFDVVAGDPATLAADNGRGGWLESVADHERDRLDGFGLALWGVWDRHPPE
ncbi:MAG TPA: type III-B CRISPR module-associated Cmr3 family protein [Phycisphaerales bacterium]|nr:type III-B CRISPR module-associated Cmr3 family protein [Phycisphaerales bacterium]HMP38562.1 type III-B CRISPR module-associated Cmr3 family protein [Phycisphaerales bacterium]